MKFQLFHLIAKREIDWFDIVFCHQALIRRNVRSRNNDLFMITKVEMTTDDENERKKV